MASSGTFVNEFRSNYAIEIDWEIVSQNVSNNTSDVRARLYLHSLDQYATISSSADKNGYVRIDGNTSNYTVSSGNLSANQRRLLHTYTRTVSHNNDGTKSVSLSGMLDLEVTLSGTYYNEVSVSGTANLDRIDRGRMAVKVKGNWRKGNTFVKVDGSWRQAVSVFVKVDGSWRRSV